VGKTSLARSIAEATGREFAKIALGGMRDEAEIRGHRRTYLGSMPGKIIQSMKKTKHSNPLVLLDEIDKMSHDFRGDPSSALLEVLDPEQNIKFNDHYIEVDYDLSDVMFIATANSLNLPRPLMDRMEIIRISGYTEDEKLGIAKRHLIPKLTESHGLAEGEWKVSDEAVLDLIRYYTREAGVRSLERELANLARKSVKQIVSGKKTKVAVTRQNLSKFAKVRKYKYGETEKTDLVGVTTGLAYTESGGDILQIEAVKMPGGKGKVSYTGNLEKVMRESIEAASSAIRARMLDFGITPPMFMENDIHVHVPEGATPKDGPSAGVAMTTSIVSVLTGIPVKRTVAMTGEIRLSGQVLPIGGLKEKMMAALRSGIKTVLIPIDNVKDLVEIPDNIKNNLEIIPVSSVDEVLKNALVRVPQPVTWDPKTKESAPANTSSDDDRPTLPH
jgi:ATP-dependent Lon protease